MDVGVDVGAGLEVVEATVVALTGDVEVLVVAGNSRMKQSQEGPDNSCLHRIVGFVGQIQ